jgi:hypothetical protein
MALEALHIRIIANGKDWTLSGSILLDGDDAYVESGVATHSQSLRHNHSA